MIDSPDHPADASEFLAVRGVSRTYGRTVALHRIDFTVAAGELFGLLGPNGAGKTTLISIAAGLSAATSGSVTLAGRAVSPRDPDGRRRIGVAPQELAVYPELTARENLAFFGRLYGWHGQRLNDRIAAVLDTIGLADRADQRVSSYSGGMKRRLNLGLSVVHEPDTLYLDEPTTGVDPQSRAHIFDEVRRLNAAGMTVIYTSHYMEEVQALCHRIGILDQGRLIACDTLPNLLRVLAGRIELRASAIPDGLVERLHQLPGVKQVVAESGRLELTCEHAQSALQPLLTVLGDGGVAVTELALHEPTLERVFLHLTGRGLRD